MSRILYTEGDLPQCMLGYHPPPRPGRHPPWNQAGTPPRPGTPLGPGTPWTRQALRPRPGRHPSPRSRACWEIRSTSGRYASYWNAILLSDLIAKVQGSSNAWFIPFVSMLMFAFRSSFTNAVDFTNCNPFPVSLGSFLS